MATTSSMCLFVSHDSRKDRSMVFVGFGTKVVFELPPICVLFKLRSFFWSRKKGSRAVDIESNQSFHLVRQWALLHVVVFFKGDGTWPFLLSLCFPKLAVRTYI